MRKMKMFKSHDKRLNYGLAFSWAFLGTMLVASSVAQATDLQIYASPAAGKKTIVMMLDTSGSMGIVNSSGFSIPDDYGLSCGTSSSRYNQGYIDKPNNGNSLTRFNDNTAYYVDSGTNPSYDRNFCYVSKSSERDVPDRVKDPNTGCEKISDTTYRCYDRLTRLKDGMFAFLESINPVLTNIRVGLGHYSVNGGGNAGKILVSAAPLDGVGSTQRAMLKNAVAGLTATGGTPTAAAYAEAAAYLMGTTTMSSSVLQNPSKYFSYITSQTNYLWYQCQKNDRQGYCSNWNSNAISAPNVSNYSSYNCRNQQIGSTNYSGTCYYGRDYNDAYMQVTGSPTPITNWAACTVWDATGCTNWDSISAPSSSALNGLNPQGCNNITVGNSSYSGTCYNDTQPKTIYGNNPYSGFSNSEQSTKNPETNYTLYRSPLPAVNDRQSCDGQGVYILSDGVPTPKTDSTLESVMNAALNSTSFNCSAAGGLGTDNDWHCMSNFAKKLFNQSQNPAGVSIQTAFVGFGAALNDLSTNDTDAINACKLSSRTQDDRSSDDVCSPTARTNAVAKPGYGNGGFFPTQSATGVTNSVIAFINNLGVAPLDPLSTGAISVPVDALNPSGFQPYGYLRALEPNPAQPVMVWLGNLKKYQILNGTLQDGSSTIFNSLGTFNTNTKDLWNNTTANDGGSVIKGGVYSRLPMPTQSTPEQLRRIFTDVSSVTNGTLNKISVSDSGLLAVPAKPADSNTATNGAYVLDRFTNQSVLKDFPVALKLKLLNYLGYDVDLTANTTLPGSLPAPQTPFVSLGGSIHSFPVQLTYSGNLDANGNLTTVREQSVMYGTMEGGLHVVNASTGVEQMVFVPADILENSDLSRALRKGEGGSLAYGVDGAWIADPTYKTVRSSEADVASTVTAKTMNVYGGMRMGGTSYYGLDVLNPASPKLLFRIGADQSAYSRMGQTWSKPVLANVRYNDSIRRVMIVGGGYDMCYEYPRFKLNTTNPTEYGGGCNKAQAQGNAVYIIDANTGERLWWASSSGADTNNTNMQHSIVTRISTLDRNADGLVDHLYFGDLGGQVFRADLNNAIGTTTANFGKRVVRLANLATTAAGSAITNGDQPRFYQPPTITIHDQGSNTFILVGIASGDRSTPLDVTPTQGREGMLPSTALTDRPTNKVYGLIDHDFIKTNLISGNPTLTSENITLSRLQANPQLLTGNVIDTFLPVTSSSKLGWYRSLSSKYDGTELVGSAVGGVTRVSGGVKAFEEEPLAIKDNLFIPVYDPQGTGVAVGDPCKPRIVGETNRQQYCLPFGACLTTSGAKDTTAEAKTGFQLSSTGTNANVLGAGIRGITLGPKETTAGGGTAANSCGSLTLLGNTSGTGEWQCTRKLNPTRWYEKYITS